MDAIAALARITSTQRCFEVVGALMLTAYLFPKQASVTDQEQFDFIVIGAGSAGAVVAARLAESNFRVLLVEAGGDPPQQSVLPGLFGYLPRTRYDWNYTTENDNYGFQCHHAKTANLTSGHVLGGGSSVNYMLYVRGCPDDFTSWAAAANDTTWDYDGVLPYFIKSERLQDRMVFISPQAKYHGAEGFLGVSKQPNLNTENFLESFRELGHKIILDINADDHLGYTEPMFTIADGARQSTAYTILAEQKNNPNLHVLKDTFVTKILFDKDNNAIGIEAFTKDTQKLTLLASKELIVSAGALNTPRLLMLSGIGPKEHLESLNIAVRSDLPVGKNLQDHVPVMMTIKLEEMREPPPAIDVRGFPSEVFTGYVALNKSKYCPDYQTINFIIPNDSEFILDSCVFNYGYDYDICQNFYESGKGRRTLFTTLGILHPKSRGRVLLRSVNPGDPPLIYGGHLTDKRDLETIVDSMIDFVKILNTSYFKSLNAEMADLKLVPCKGLKYWSREWWRCYALCMMSTFYHYSGTCALGAVVDSGLRVHGVGRLRVADASIMPELVGANTNAATIMIGEKAADIIKQEHVPWIILPINFYPYWAKLFWYK
ncbi:ecdysone oxidase-like [Epargyreus clarus]|uniref:ecdysone oxidase-like n=1 Tax=Epargyreus clarus TaxID=520877 RepID=UPI003C2C6749